MSDEKTTPAPETSPPETLREQLRAVIGETHAPQEGDLLEQVRWLVGEIARLEPLAQIGQQYRADLIEETLSEGVRAQGDKFPEASYREMLERSGIDHIKTVRDAFAEQAKALLKGGRITVDGDETANAAPQQTPDLAAHQPRESEAAYL